MTARDIAFKVLLQVERADAYLNLALDAALKSAGALPRQESALATELCYGVMRRRNALDAAIAKFCDRPLKKLETQVLVALRIGAYQLLYLTRVPPHAAVGETVALAKRQKLERAAGMINAILRRISQSREVPLPDDPVERLSVEESHPSWLIRRWNERIGAEETAALCRANNAPPPLCVRTNLTRNSREALLEALAAEGVSASPTRLSPLGVLLEDPGALTALSSFEKGLFQVQDEAAQLVSLLCAARPGMRILDACAAPGGKTCHLAEQLGGSGEVVALDLYPRKLERLLNEARRLGLEERVKPLARDASKPLPFDEASFDLILLDAPCTGLGTLRRHPELRYKRTEADIPRLAALQRSILENVVRYLKPGGTLVYAVCSMEPEEGSGHLPWLLDHGFSLVSGEADGAAWYDVQDPSGGIATFPHRHGTDGFYAARLLRA